MRRIHLFEFLDLPWYPQAFRRMQTDYLQFAATLGMGHQNLVPLLAKAMQHASTTKIVDLCSGGVRTLDALGAALQAVWLIRQHPAHR